MPRCLRRECVAVVSLLGLLSCAPEAQESSHEGVQLDARDGSATSPSADGGSPAPTRDGAPASQPKTYRLCDGTPEVRLAMHVGGGGVGPLYDFTHPYGYSFLFVFGDCSFVVSPKIGAREDAREGVLTPAQAGELETLLRLENLSGKAYFDAESCPDAGLAWMTTADGYADCTCGCPDAPKDVLETFGAGEKVFERLQSIGRPMRGPLELLAITWDEDVKFEANASWPLGRRLHEFASTYREYRNSGLVLPQVLVGEDAARLRAVRDSVRTHSALESTAVVDEAGIKYLLFLRNQLASDRLLSIERFRNAHDPTVARPLELCRAAEPVDVRIGSADLYDDEFRAYVESADGCQLQLCWEGDFDESAPVQTRLRVERVHARRCLGKAAYALQTNLEPMRAAFRRSYPGTPVEIQLGLAGYREKQFTLNDHARERAACAERSTTDCAEDARCRPISATPFDLQRGCQGTARVVACGATVVPCDDGVMPARARDGSTWWFTNGCLPVGYDVLDTSGVSVDALPLCTP